MDEAQRYWSVLRSLAFKKAPDYVQLQIIMIIFVSRIIFNGKSFVAKKPLNHASMKIARRENGFDYYYLTGLW